MKEKVKFSPVVYFVRLRQT